MVEEGNITKNITVLGQQRQRILLGIFSGIVVGVCLLFCIYKYFLFHYFEKKQLTQIPNLHDPTVLGIGDSQTSVSTSPSPSPPITLNNPKTLGTSTISNSPVVTTQPTHTPEPSPLPTPIQQASSAPVANLTQPSLMSPSATISAQNNELPFADRFEQGINNWYFSGDVYLIDQLLNPDLLVKSTHQFFVRIGRPNNPGLPLSKNQFSRNLPANARKISFTYNFYSYDYVGFDDPAFTVSIDTNLLFQLKAADLDQDSPQTTAEHLDSTGWKTVQLDVSTFSKTSNSQLIFQSGNDELNLPSPNEHQSWVYLAEVTIE